jgi:hypothetical protein
MTDDDDQRLPELRTAELDAETLETLLADLATYTRIDSVQLKGGSEELCREARASLDGLRQLLLDKSVRGAQVRYHYEGDDWCDTLIVTDGGVRLVRMRRAPEGE